MSLFKHKNKNKTIGKGTDRTVTLLKEFEVLNCTPVDYRNTYEYSDFLLNAENIFRNIVQKTSIDDLNCDMLDSFIQSKTDEMKSSAKEQYVYHIQVIHHHKGLVEGELIRANGHRSNLQIDLEELEKDICKYKIIKEEYNIH